MSLDKTEFHAPKLIHPSSSSSSSSMIQMNMNRSHNTGTGRSNHKLNLSMVNEREISTSGQSAITLLSASSISSLVRRYVCIYILSLYIYIHISNKNMFIYKCIVIY